MKLLIVFVLLVVVTVYGYTDAELEEWNQFKTKYGKVYEAEEDLNRLAQFLKTKKIVEAHNKEFEKGTQKFKQGLNHFADLFESELNNLFGYKKPNVKGRYGGPNALTFEDSGAPVPDYVNWLEKGAVTRVKDQGQCGVCWSFSTTGSLEGQMFLKTGRLVELSEQNLVDCMQGSSCQGNWMDTAFEFIKDHGGIDSEESYPFLGDRGQGGYCRYNSMYNSASVSGYVDIPYGDENLLMKAVGQIGPISVAIDASHQSFQNYHSGIYYEPQCQQNAPTHAVLVVGYGTEENGQDYWLVKNSWNTWWGENGYFKLPRNYENHCGIASYASFPLI